MPLHSLTTTRPAAALTAAALLVTLSACSPGPSNRAPETASTVPTTEASGLPSSHVHGLSVDRATDQVLLDA